MKISIIISCFIALCLGSCKMGDHTKNNPAIAKDTLTYTYKTIKERASNCGDKAESNCTLAIIKFPVFHGQNALNDTINHKLATLFQINEKPDTGVNQLVKHFLLNYQSSKDTIIYTLDCYAKVIRQDSDFVALQYGGYSFEGGAHPSSYTGFINWNIQLNKLISLSGLFTDTGLKKLTRIADTIFRRNEKLTMDASLATDYFFKGNKFALPLTFSITPLGIRFFYNEYEIKPYAAGTTDLFIPYAKIKSLLRPGSVTTQYFK